MPISEKQTISSKEFIVLMALMFATVAFSIDALLPAIPIITDELTDPQSNQAAWVLTSFVAGMGFGTFFSGPLSDAYGRKPVIYAGSFLYILGAACAWATSSIEWMLIARFVQGIGGAGPRVVSVAIIRDLFVGRQMARIMSIVISIFILVPAIAPSLSMLIITFFGWRSIFAAFIIFSLITVIWSGVRLKEPLAIENRRPMTRKLIIDAFKQIANHKVVRLSIIVQTLILSMLFSTLTMIQQIFDQVFGRAETFPYWFGVIALLAGGVSIINSVIVMKFGMRRVVVMALNIEVIVCLLSILMMYFFPTFMFPVFIFWLFILFSLASLTMGNLNTIAMEPMGHIAGMAASIIGGVSTICAAVIATPIALFLDDAPYSLLIFVLFFAVSALIFTIYMNRLSRLQSS